jgi:cell division protein FtsL
MKPIHLPLLLSLALCVMPVGPWSCAEKPLIASRDTDPYYLEQKVKDRYEAYARLKLEEEAAASSDRAEDAATYRGAKEKAYQEYLEAEAEYARVLEDIKRQEDVSRPVKAK